MSKSFLMFLSKSFLMFLSKSLLMLSKSFLGIVFLEMLDVHIPSAGIKFYL